MKPAYHASILAVASAALVVPHPNSFTFTNALYEASKPRAVENDLETSAFDDATQKWKKDCFERVPAYGLLQVENPGAGMSPDDIKPYQIVLKDGFMMVACVKDAMYEHGDKFGSNKLGYRNGPVANTSIVHYTDIVMKMDRKKMTPDVCFEFCRGVPDMGFFGINNGRDCYCTPYYEVMPGGSSKCDSVCEGDPSRMCGGETKVSVFEMHMCDTTEEDLKKSSKHADSVEHHMEDVCGHMQDVAKGADHAAMSMQKAFGKIGDPQASKQMQNTRVNSGKWLHWSQDCLDFAEVMKKLVKKKDDFKGKDLKKYKNRKAAEDQIAELDKDSIEGERILTEHMLAWDDVQPGSGRAAKLARQFLPRVLSQYYSIMYFVDKEYANDTTVPVTCDGDLIGEPALGYDAGHCAAACDDHVGECVGFAAYEYHHKDEHAVICHLFSKFKTVQYYTGCEKKKVDFLAQNKHQKVHMDTTISGFTTRQNHSIHINFTAKEQAQCAQRSASASCKEARKAISPDGKELDYCFLTPNNLWKFPELPGYFSCLQACCQDYDPKLMMDGLTCSEVMSYYANPCEELFEVRNPPPGTKIKDICPKSCKKCSGPVKDHKTTSTTTTPAAIFKTTAHPVVKAEIMKAAQPNLDTEIKAMCRAKFSEFGSISLKPDETGKSKFALKELTKANRCFD